MKIETNKVIVSELFPIQAQSRLKVPIYQRQYSWTNQNIEDLFEDIRQEDPGYYVGNIIETDNEGIPEIVDGQQRITTLAFMLLAIYKQITYLQDTNEFSKSLLEDAGSMKNDLKRQLLINNTEPRLTLLPNDQRLWSELLNHQLLHEEVRPPENRIFIKRFQYAYNLVQDKFDSLTNLRKFMNQLNSVELLRLTVSNIADAFSIFSSLNSKGQPLTLIDLLKTEYLSVADKDSVSGEVSFNRWNNLLRVFQDEQDDVSNVAVTQFFQNNYDAFESNEYSSITKTKALRSYQKLFNDKRSGYINNLIAHARLFSVMSPLLTTQDDDISPTTARLLEQLQKLDATTSYPLIFRLLDALKTGKLREDDANHIFKYLITFYVRRNLVQRPKSSNIRSHFIGLIRNLSDDSRSSLESSEICSAVLTSINQIIPADSEFKASLGNGVYDVSKDTTRFLLISVERSLRPQSKEYSDSFDGYTTNLKKPQLIWSIEHILPETKNLKNGWPEMISPEDPSKASDVQAAYLHKLGNLTLTGYNSEMGDRSFQDKLTYKNAQGKAGLNTTLKINQTIITSDETWNTKKNWTPKDIERRNIWFTRQIMALYPLTDLQQKD